MISYNDIYESLRKERYSEQLQPLPKKFIYEVSEYIKEKKTLFQQSSNSQDSLFEEDITKMKKQLENAVAIFNELLLLRKKKLLSLVFVASETGINKRDFDNMLDFERELFDKIIGSVQEAEKKVSSELNTNGYNGDKGEAKLILFLEDIEEFVSLDGKTLGPFKKDELSLLPKQVAEILIGDKKAESVLED